MLNCTEPIHKVQHGYFAPNVVNNNNYDDKDPLFRNAARSINVRSLSSPLHFLNKNAFSGCIANALGSQSTMITFERSRFRHERSYNITYSTPILLK